MRRDKYVFNNNTLQYEKEEKTMKQRLLRFSLYTFSVLACSVALYMTAYTFIPTPKEISMQREMKQIEYQFSSLTSDFEKYLTK